MMKKIIYTLCACFLLLTIFQGTLSAQRKGEMKDSSGKGGKMPMQKMSYEDVFRGKKVRTSKGLMTIHSVNDHGRELVYVEFPKNLLEKDMMLTTSVRETSDVGSCAVGQFGDFIYLRFYLKDDNLEARAIVGDEPVNLTGDKRVEGVLEETHKPGILQIMHVVAYTPDSSAVVVDMTHFFMDQTDYTNPFSSFNGNIMGGNRSGLQRLRPELSKLVQVTAYDNNISVTGDYGYSVDYSFMGTVYMRNKPVSVTADRILMLMPEEIMRPRIADVRVGAVRLPKMVISHIDEGFRKKVYALRRRIEPSDEAAYYAGQLVEPKKPVVFYMDTLMPQDWKKAIKDGAEAWNEAFEAAGFKNVVRVVEFPKNDPKFSAFDISNSVIRYVPSWNSYAQNSLHVDMRSGEILNSSIMVYGQLMQGLCLQYRVAVMSSDLTARTNDELPENTRYEILKTYISQMVGNCLGLTSNARPDGVYPVDSLRSPSFTQKYGLSPSIMGYYITYNYIASEDDVARGVRLIPRSIGEGDKYTVKWLYAPIYEAKTADEEVPVLDQWIAQEENNPACSFGFPSGLRFDPSSTPGILGNDHLKSMEYYMEHLKYALDHLDAWYSQGDKDYSKRAELMKWLFNDVGFKIRMILSHVGGFRYNLGENGASYDFVTKDEEQKYINLMFRWMREIPQMRQRDLEKKMGLGDDPTFMEVWDCFVQLFGRAELIYFAQEKGSKGYTAEEFVEELSRRVWAPTVQGKSSLTGIEKTMQLSMLGTMLLSSGIQVLPPMMMQGQQVPQGGDRKVATDLYGAVTMTKLWGNGVYKTADQSLALDPQLDVRVVREPVQHIYFKMLLHTKAIIEKALPNSSGELRAHYELMLYKIHELMDKES
ncbi:zinc-dependent metalloprotease [Butyricimonas paravirosa]